MMEFSLYIRPKKCTSQYRVEQRALVLPQVCEGPAVVGQNGVGLARESVGHAA